MNIQGNSLWDIVDQEDHSTVLTILQRAVTEMDVLQDVHFLCRMNICRTLKRPTSVGDVKVDACLVNLLPVLIGLFDILSIIN